MVPVGMLIYWVHRFDEDNAVISGMWYYKEIHVPSTVDKKMQSILDLKANRCAVLNLHGTFGQILDPLLQSDCFHNAGKIEVHQFINLKDKLHNSTENKAHVFDEIQNLKGTSLMIDTVVDVDETMEDIKTQLKTGKALIVNISENWSFAVDLNKIFVNEYSSHGLLKNTSK